MAVIHLIVALIVLGTLYKKMIGWEAPPGISKGQAIVPVLLGLAAVPLSFILFIAIGVSVKNVFGYGVGDGPLLLGSFTAAFLSAGLNEELAKLLMILIVIGIFGKKAGNVYEYMLIGAGVGFGFTLFEEFVYGSGIAALVGRILTVTAHMMLGLAMGRHLGLARYNKVTGRGSVWKERLLAFWVPVAVHTLYDTLAVNKFLHAFDDRDYENLTAYEEKMLMIGSIMVVTGIVLLFALQFFVFRRLKRNAGKLAALSFVPEEAGAAG